MRGVGAILRPQVRARVPTKVEEPGGSRIMTLVNSDLSPLDEITLFTSKVSSTHPKHAA